MTARILVATDLSDAAEEAVRQADAYARAVGGSFAVCTVVPPLHTVHMFFPQLYQSEATEIGGLTREVDDAVRKGVERLTSRKRDQFELFIDYGTDYAEIVRRAETWGATRLFVGAQGRTGLARLLLGSVAEKVVRYAHCPVFIARPERSGPVLAATDRSDPSMPALAAAAEEARRRSAKLTVLHVLDPELVFGGMSPEPGTMRVFPSADSWIEMRDAAREQLTLAARAFSIETEILVMDGMPTATILQAVDRLAPQLLVIGTHGRTGLARLALGSVAEHVVRNTHVPVLCVRLARPD